MQAQLHDCRPSRNQIHLLRAALLPAERGYSDWQAWSAGLVWQEIDLASSRLLPLLERNLKSWDVAGPVPQLCRGVRKQAWTRNNLLLHRVRALCERWSGPTPVLLKGGAMTLSHYQDRGLRPMEDFDLWVPAALAPEMAGFLHTQGWSYDRRDYCRREADYQVWHGFGLCNPEGLNLDLHGHILHDRCLDQVTHELTRTAIAAPDFPARLLAPPEQLLHVVTHGLRRYSAPTLLWMADAYQILRYGPELDWARLLDLARRLRLGWSLAQGLLALHELLEIAVPASVLRDLQAGAGWLEKLEYRLKTRPIGGLQNFWLYSVRYAHLCALQGRLCEPFGLSDYMRRLLGCRNFWEVPQTLRQLLRT